MRVIIFLFVYSIGFMALAQDYNFGKVSKDELLEKFNPLDSSASASYLYKYRKTYFSYTQNTGFQLITEIHERVKIYNQEGFEYATKSVRLFKNNSGREDVSRIKAYTYNLVENKVQGVKLKKDGVFNTESSSIFDETKFTMPDVKEGSVIEYQYKIFSPFYTNVNEFVFQHEIPVKKLEAEFETPEYFNFKLNTKGFIAISPKKQFVKDKITFVNKTRTDIAGWTAVQGSYSYSDVNFMKCQDQYTLLNIPALKDESYVNNINNYRSSVKYELSYTDFPNSTKEYYSTSWEDVVKAVYNNSNFGSELNKSGYFENDIDELINAILAPSEQMILIFDYLKSNVIWDENYGKYTYAGVRKAYKDKVGNVAEINLMLTSMLRYAGLNANPVLVSTKNNGIPLFPTREGYNYVVSAVELPTGIFLLDATSKYSSPNILPLRVLNWDGRIITKDGNSRLISLYPNTNSKKSISMMANIDSGGTVEGSYRVLKTNHYALSYRNNFSELDEANFLEQLENKYGGMEVSDFEVTNTTNVIEPIIETYKFVKESQADIIGDKIYFSPLLFLATKENPFKLEKREFPVDFGYPTEDVYRIMITLPEGYRIESMPEDAVFALPNNIGSFRYNLSQKDSFINLLVTTEINKPIISPIHYDALKEYFKLLIEKENEQIVLIKI